MDTRFEVTDGPRPIPADVDGDVPLVTMAWQSLKGLYAERAEEAGRQERQARRVEELLIAVAEEAHRLRRLARLGRSAAEGDARPLRAAADRLEQALARMDVDVVAPEGEPYTSALMEFLENSAQRPEPGLTEPRVAEVLTPAVLLRGGLLRMGKAVIAAPAGPPH